MFKNKFLNPVLAIGACLIVAPWSAAVSLTLTPSAVEDYESFSPAGTVIVVNATAADSLVSVAPGGTGNPSNFAATVDPSASTNNGNIDNTVITANTSPTFASGTQVYYAAWLSYDVRSGRTMLVAPKNSSGASGPQFGFINSGGGAKFYIPGTSARAQCDRQ